MQDRTIDGQAAIAALMPLADSFDRSWSILGSGEAEERFLLFFDQPDQRVEAVADAAAMLGLPEDAIARWRAGLSGADAIGIAVNRGLTSIRLYLQYWDLLVNRVEAGNLDDFVLYRGIKGLPGGGLRDDQYVCTPIAPHSTFWPPLEHSMTGVGLPAPALAAALADLDAETCIFTRTRNAARSSWLATVRRAELDRGAWLEALAGLPDRDWATDLRRHAETADLLHLAGGRDSAKGAFATIYFTATADDLLTGLAL
ncbi:MAG: hypothetical protein GC146_10615 [Limimaricola sp.]|uniref:hypothetical protein n=1 Tax=Limimaricola sp. TaxID=2211665 RepID=UPI001D9395BE|nr:hypothetical protein [Limimaricola sp.]MBI1417663.1 hypothetical protein [Limimaricola sp.]